MKSLILVLAAAVLAATPVAAQGPGGMSSQPWSLQQLPTSEYARVQKEADNEKALIEAWKRSGSEQVNRTEPPKTVVPGTNRNYQLLQVERAKVRCQSALTPRTQRCRDL